MTIEMRLDATPDAAGRVRAAVTTALDRSLPREVVENVLMVATELVSNSVMHAGLAPGDQIAFRLRAERRIRVEVEDAGRGFGGREPRVVDPGRAIRRARADDRGPAERGLGRARRTARCSSGPSSRAGRSRPRVSGPRPSGTPRGDLT